MRMDGSFERLLDDDKVGWQAGNWDINKRSVAICLDNDYENQDPSDEILKKLAKFIKKNYPKIQPGKIVGHCEARQGTICPGINFKIIWKSKLLELLKA
jgi:N-acetyl-anhydromuramyl-L-alanine amidase AmpD